MRRSILHPHRAERLITLPRLKRSIALTAQLRDIDILIAFTKIPFQQYRLTLGVYDFFRPCFTCVYLKLNFALIIADQANVDFLSIRHDYRLHPHHALQLYHDRNARVVIQRCHDRRVRHFQVTHAGQYPVAFNYVVAQKELVTAKG
jgi:hypothetical protein